MKKKRLAADHRDLKRDSPAVEVCRRQGVSETTFQPWKARFGGLAVRSQLEAENTPLKRLLAEAHLDNVVLKDLLSKG
jgi:putative transposase